MNVDPPFQGNGIAKKLLKAAEEDMFQKSIKKIRLEVSMGNIPALKLYEKSGFRIKSILKNYYYNEHNGTLDAFRMIKELNIDIVDFCVLTPFPGTPIYNMLKKEGRILTKDWSKYNLKTVVFEPKNMTPDELKQGIIKIYSEFYSPIYTLKRVLGSLNLGIYPFFMVLARNAISNMNRRILFSSKN